MGKSFQSYDFDDLFLWSGTNLQINEYITVKHPRIFDILNLGKDCEKRYMSLLSAIASNSYEKKVQLWMRMVDYEKVDDYAAFCFLFYSTYELLSSGNVDENIYDSSLSFFLGKQDSSFMLTSKNDDLLFVDKTHPEIQFGKDEFFLVQKFLRAIHYWSNEEPPKAANESVKKALIEFEIEKLEFQSEWECYLGNIVSSTVDINTDINSIPIYRLHTAFKRKQKEINYKLTMSGYYTGNVKLTPSQMDEILWYGTLNSN